MQLASRLVGDTLYYVTAEKLQDSEDAETSLFRKPADGETEMLFRAENAEILWHCAEPEGNIALFYEVKEEIPRYFLRRQTGNGEVIYEKEIAVEEMDSAVLDAGVHGAVSSQGEVCLATAAGQLYFFAEDGTLEQTGEAGWNRESYHGGRCGLVNCGKQGIFVYQICESGEIVLDRVDFEKGNTQKFGSFSVAEKESAELGGIFAGNDDFLSLDIFDGYDRGMLLSDSRGLWQYQPETDAVTLLFSWGDSRVNLQDYMIDAVGVLPENGFYVQARRSYDDVAYVRVEYQGAQELPEKQLVTLGGISTYEIPWEEVTKMVSSFNRQSSAYQVELQPYESIDDFYMDLVRGQGPDIIHLDCLQVAVLADKEVLENLEPYFDASNIVKTEDLLPSIKRAGTVGGKLRAVIPEFRIEALLVDKNAVSGEGWTADAFLTLAEKNPNSQLLPHSNAYKNMILNTVLTGDIDSYIDWQEGCCSFDRPEFTELLRRIQELPTPDRERIDPLSPGYFEEYWKQFTEKAYLVREKYISGLCSLEPESLYNGGGLSEGDYARLIGQPNGSGEPYFELMTEYAFAINSASPQKEGAWAFLEYLLSEEYQSDNARYGFPVRTDSFDAYMEKEMIFRTKVNVSEKDREYLRWMIDHAYWKSENAYCLDIRMIVSEETEALWAGDCSAETAARNIQSRVSIYLAE